MHIGETCHRILDAVNPLPKTKGQISEELGVAGVLDPYLNALVGRGLVTLVDQIVTITAEGMVEVDE